VEQPTVNDGVGIEKTLAGRSEGRTSTIKFAAFGSPAPRFFFEGKVPSRHHHVFFLGTRRHA
jgi:hypothetical protein